MTAPPHPRSKAQARWKILRQAILSSAASSSSLPQPPHPEDGSIRTYTIPLPSPSSFSSFSSSSCPTRLTLRLPTPSPPSSSSSTSSLAALVSHRPEMAGVDNTGNVQVWPAEEALLALLLGKGHDKQMGTRRPRRILELGAGCTGLVGLGLAMAWGSDSNSTDRFSSSWSSASSSSSPAATATPTTTITTASPSENSPPLVSLSPMYVCLTDGHPDCVSSLHKSLGLNQAQLPPRVRVEVQRLVWKEGERQNDDGKQRGEEERTGDSWNELNGSRVRRKEDGGVVAAELPLHDVRFLDDQDANANNHPSRDRDSFDLIVAADVLFFERFHPALLHTLHTHLNPEGGEAWLLQPSRGGSLERFVALIEEEEGWEVGWEGEKAKGYYEDGGNERLQLLKLRRMIIAKGERRKLKEGKD